MFNTYGLMSVNRESFNLFPHGYRHELNYPKEGRNFLTTALRIHNGALNFCEYIPMVGVLSSTVRIMTGLSLMIHTIRVGERDAREGVIIGHWYDEALATGLAQVSRGIFGGFVPFGRLINASIDVAATVINMHREFCHNTDIVNPSDINNNTIKESSLMYQEPSYPGPFLPLYLA